MKYLVCPQCGIRRFHVRNDAGKAITVQITTDFEIVPVDPNQSLEGYNLDILICLGCSWKGSKEGLIKYFT